MKNLTQKFQQSMDTHNKEHRAIVSRISLHHLDLMHACLYGNQGGYTPAMGPNMKQQACPKCGTLIEKLSMGRCHVFLCPNCQV